MKNLLALGLAALLATHCTADPALSRPAVPPSASSDRSRDLLVISATYGSGTKFADVTNRVNDLLHQPSVEFFARPEWLHADPTPGWNKALVIVYEYKGRRSLFSTGEGGRVSVNELLRGTDF
jgi:hypothetical protein